MIFFRLVLYIICLFSIGWSILFFGGPSLIKKLAVSYTGGAVKLSNVSLSPMFHVKIGRLDFTIPNMNDGTTTSGFSRSTEIIWSVQNGRPFLTFDVGPTYVEEIFSLENIKIHTPSFNKMDWQNLLLVANASDLVMHSLGEADKVYFDGNYSSTSNRIIDLSIDARVVNLKEFDQTLSVDVVTFAFDEFDLTSSLGDQYFSGRFTAKNIASENPVFMAQNGTGNINISPLTKNVSLDLLNMTFASSGGAINKVNLSADYNTGYALNNLSLNLTNGTFGNRAPSFSNISVDMVRRNDNFSDFIFSGDLHEFEFYNEDNYVGLIPASNFNARLEFDEKSSNLLGNSNIRFASTDAVGISGSAEVGL
ncbi:MAG: hypothetical protein CMH04_13115, partial [Marinovum sp.]|nr:hypothetical protein [Marinovum sp.]